VKPMVVIDRHKNTEKRMVARIGHGSWRVNTSQSRPDKID
jgi:argininosuccinate lyase